MANNAAAASFLFEASMGSAKLQKQMGDMKTLWSKTMTKATESAFTVRELRGLEKVKDKYAKAMTEAAVKWNVAAERLARDRNDEEALAIARLSKQRMKDLKEEQKAYIKSNEVVSDKRLAAAEKYKAAFGEDLDRTMFSAAKAEDLGESIGSAFSDATSGDLKSWAGLVKKLGAHAGKTGARLEAGAGAEGGKGGKVAGGLGKMLGGLGGAIMAIAGVAAVLAAVVKVILDADAATKELNRSLLDSGVSGADLADTYGDVTQAINNTRQAYSKAIEFNMKWGTTAKDNLEILGAYAEAGLTFKEITKGSKDATEQMESLQNATQMTLIYSKLLGKTTSEVAADSAKRMTDFGLTLKGVAEQFSSIIAFAKDSGFATKRFYGMILQATSGMSMYNVRLSEASELLLMLGKTLGQDLSGDFLDSLTKGFKDESTQERVRKSMTTGVETSLDILRKGAVNAAEEFQKSLMGFAKENGTEANAFWDAIGKGIGKSGAEARSMGAEELSKALQKVPNAKRGQMLAEAGAVGGPGTKDIVDGLSRQLGAVAGKSQAFGSGVEAAQAAREFAGPAEVLALNLNELQQVIGKRVDQIDMTNIKERMAWESLTGLQGEAARKLFEIGQRYAGINKSLSDEQEAIKKASPSEALERAKKWNEKYAKEFGYMVDETGKRFKAVLDPGSPGGFMQGSEIKGTDVNDLITGMGDGINEAVGSTLSQDLQTAMEIADNTRDLSHIMEVGVTALLEEISGAVQWIASWLGSSAGAEREAKTAATEELDKKLEELGRKSSSLQDRRGVLAGEIKGGQFTGDDLASREAELKAIDEDRKSLIEQQRQTREKRRVIRGVKGATTKEGVLAAAGGATVQSAMDRLTPEQKVNVEARAKAKYDKQLAARQTVQAYNAKQEEVFLRSGGSEFSKGANLMDVPAMPDMATLKAEEVNADMVNDELKAVHAAEKREEDKRAATLLKGVSNIVDALEMQQMSDYLKNVGGFSNEEMPGIASSFVKRGLGVPEMAGMSADQIRELTKGPQAHDMVMQVGSNGVKFAQRVDQNDVGVFSKPGGALSKAGGSGGGGNSVNVFHLYNDGAGVMKTIQKAQKAGIMR